MAIKPLKRGDKRLYYLRFTSGSDATLEIHTLRLEGSKEVFQLQEVTPGDSVKVKGSRIFRLLYKSDGTTRPIAKIVYQTNHLPGKEQSFQIGVRVP